MDVVIIGEILWDQFANDNFIGGAPFNVAVNLKRFGDDIAFISGVGNEELGKSALAQIETHDLDTRYITITDQAPTGIVNITLRDGQPDYIIRRPAAYDMVKLSDEDIKCIQRGNPKWIYFGTLAQSSETVRKTTEKIIASNPQAKVFYDVNLRKGNRDPALIRNLLAQADIVKLNEDELQELVSFLDMPEASLKEKCRRFSCQCSLEGILVTLGANGCVAYDRGTEKYLTASGLKIDLEDAVGAGDAFSAAFLHSCISGDEWIDAINLGNRLGSLIASRKSALPVWTIEELSTPMTTRTAQTGRR